MESVFSALLVLFVITGLSYFILISFYCYAWIKTESPHLNNEQPVRVTVIIPARNEEHTIADCLSSVINQHYPSQYIEIIVVDDASTDGTNEKVLEIQRDFPQIQLITLADKDGGKKNAIRTAIENATGQLIITTDADCTRKKNWLKTIVGFFIETKAKMIVAPVCFYNEGNGFEKMQSLEFMALIASSGASIYFNKATMCNGANLVYTREVFQEVNGFENIDKIASGDDVLLMYKIKQKYPEGTAFLKSRDAIVYTKAKPTVKEFIEQRRRWASKGFFSMNKETKIVSLIVYFFNFFLLTLPVAAFFCLPNIPFRLCFFKISLIIMGIKAFIDFLFLFLAASFFKKKDLLIYFLPEQLVYIVYVVVIGLLGTAGKYKWKDRNVHG